ncbi:MAG: glycoside hydrolase family 5 protein [Armatimonadota bacterium]
MFNKFASACRMGVLTVATIILGTAAFAAPPAGSSESEAIVFARRMGVGWNLGNTLEATGIKGKTVRDYETAWGNPVTNKKMIDGVRAAGFRSMRVPVAWSNLIGPGPDYVINKELMARVEQVAGYGLDNGMYVIINIHWDGGWIHKFSTDYDGSKQKYKAVWRQVAARFKDHSDHLIFESMNEEGSFEDLWNVYGGKPDQKDKAYLLLNKINQEFTDLVRASGGSNGRRYLLIAGYGTDIGRTVDPAFRMPRDSVKHSMVSVHYYSPPTFAILEKDASWGKAAYTWGTPSEVEAVKRDMLPLKARFLDKGIPVVVGEFGCPTVNKDTTSVVKYLTTVCETARSLGCVPMLWDTGNIYDRKTLRFRNPQLGEALTRIAVSGQP